MAKSRAMRAASIVLVALLAVGIAAAQQPAHPPETPPPQAAAPAQRGQIDPPGQCAYITKDHRELAPLEKACETAVAASETLPNFVCDVRMTRKEPLRRTENITGELRYLDGEEELSDIKVNNKPVDNKTFESSGVIARGEFAPPGLSILDGRSLPAFVFRGEEKTTTAATVLVFDYTIAKANNQAWKWSIPGFEYRPGLHGQLRIDKETGLLSYVSLVADDIDKFVPTLSNVTTTEFAVVKFGELGEYQLPVHSTVKTCGRFEPGCVEIERDFVNCRKFAGKARIVE